MDGPLDLEDFRPGARLVSSEREIDRSVVEAFAEISGDRHPVHTPGAVPDGEIMAHGPFGIAAYFGSVFDSGVLAESLIAGLDVHWRFLAPVRLGDRIHFETVVTGWRRTSNPSRGVVHRAIDVLDDRGRVLQRGTAAVLVRSRDASQADPPWALPLGTGWSQAVAATLESDPAFAEQTQLLDVTIALASDVAETQLRIYRGRIIDVATRTPHGPDFTVRAEGRHWVELLTGGRNDLLARSHSGEFAASGDMHSYLQLTQLLHLIVDAGRRVSGEGA